MGGLLVDCSKAPGNWTLDSGSNRALSFLPRNANNKTQPKCLSAKPSNFETGAFFGGPKPSVTGMDDCPSGSGGANTSQFTLGDNGELRVGDGSVCLTAEPLYGLQLWSKPLGNHTVAALIVNLLDPPGGAQTGVVPLVDIPGAGSTFRSALDVWTGETTTLSEPQLEVTLRGHQSAFYILSADADSVQRSSTFYSPRHARLKTDDVMPTQKKRPENGSLPTHAVRIDGYDIGAKHAAATPATC